MDKTADGDASPLNLLRLKRRARGWSQPDLARRLGTNKYQVSRWERGAFVPNPFFLAMLSQIFRVSRERLLDSLSRTRHTPVRRKARKRRRPPNPSPPLAA